MTIVRARCGECRAINMVEARAAYLGQAKCTSCNGIISTRTVPPKGTRSLNKVLLVGSATVVGIGSVLVVAWVLVQAFGADQTTLLERGVESNSADHSLAASPELTYDAWSKHMYIERAILPRQGVIDRDFADKVLSSYGAIELTSVVDFELALWVAALKQAATRLIDADRMRAEHASNAAVADPSRAAMAYSVGKAIIDWEWEAGFVENAKKLFEAAKQTAGVGTPMDIVERYDAAAVLLSHEWKKRHELHDVLVARYGWTEVIQQ